MLIFIGQSAFAQQKQLRCGTTHIPSTAREITGSRAYPRQRIEIPVVFHVVFSGEEENLPEEFILSQIDVINNDFNRIDPLTKILPKNFNKKVAVPGITFCLARTDPDGQSTNGIIRSPTTQSMVANLGAKVNGDRIIKDSELGGSSPWNTKMYLNIWIGARSDGIAGDATFPDDPDETEFDGIVLDYNAVGIRTDSEGPFNLGRTLTHEIGHYLNVFHLYGEETGCFNDDDLVKDTPNQFGPYFGSCDEEAFSCESRDMDTNFMNFRNDDCLYYFTIGQVDRMIYTLFTSRYELISSKTCSTVKPLPPDPLKIAPIINLPNGLEIPLKTLNEESYSLSLYDLTGRLVWHEISNSSHRYIIENTRLPSNVYILILQLKEELYSRKVFIN